MSPPAGTNRNAARLPGKPQGATCLDVFRANSFRAGIGCMTRIGLYLPTKATRQRAIRVIDAQEAMLPVDLSVPQSMDETGTSDLGPDVLLIEQPLSKSADHPPRDLVTASENGVPIILLSNGIDSNHALEAVRSGVTGIIELQRLEAELPEAIGTVRRGKIYLSASLREDLAFRYIDESG